MFRVELNVDYNREEFYGRMSKDGRLTVPKVNAEEFLEEFEEESLNGYTAEVTLYPIRGEEDKE